MKNCLSRDQEWSHLFDSTGIPASIARFYNASMVAVLNSNQLNFSVTIAVTHNRSKMGIRNPIYIKLLSLVGITFYKCF